MEQAARVDILLVEDNPQDADLTMRTLTRRHVANPILHVEDGVEALDFLFNRGPYADRADVPPPRLVLLDLKLPRINGLEVLEAIKADPRTRAIPVVVLTSSREDPDVTRAYELGANSYVVKPVGFDAFTEAVGSLGMYWLLVNEHSRG
jgi:two-component system response regulator